VTLLDGLKTAVLVSLVAVIQISIVTPFEVARGHVDLVAVTLIAVALLRGPVVGALAGFWAGLILDTATLSTLGLTSLVLTLLARVGVVSGDMLAHYRKHAVMVALIISAIVTPDATLFTMLLMAVPLIILYEMGIWGAKVFGIRTPRSEAAKGLRQTTPVETAGHRVR